MKAGEALNWTPYIKSAATGAALEPAMANASLVNRRESHFPPPLFREYFPVLGRIPHLQNPFKYKRIREINRKTAHPVSHARRRRLFFPLYSVTYLPLKVPERPLPYNCALRENA
jgi:hypothetical protein